MPEAAKRLLCLLAGIAIAAAFSAPWLLFREQIRELAALGYAGLFLSCALSNISILIPSSATLIVLAAASTLNPLLCVLCGGLGTSFGEQASYLCGRIGTAAAQPVTEQGRRIADHIARHGTLTVFLFAFVPLPVFDLAGLAAGAARMPWLRYTAAAAAGKTLKFLAVVTGVYIILPRLLPYWPDPGAELLKRMLEMLRGG